MDQSNIYIIDPKEFAKALLEKDKNGNVFAQVDAAFFGIRESEIKPLDGFVFPENFPNAVCCKAAYQDAIDLFAKFPNCCDDHKKLNDAKWFKKDDFAYMPLKLATAIVYTFHCIDSCIENENWYKEITDYIEYAQMSFGSLPKGFGASFGLTLYLESLKNAINNDPDINAEKKERLSQYIDKFYIKADEKAEITDLNILEGIYKRWLKDFPFDIVFFKPLKSYFYTHLPFFSIGEDENMYSHLTTGKIMSKNELITFLTKTTETILQKTNALKLFENGQINEIQKANIDVINANRKLQLDLMIEKPKGERKQYIKLLKTWLKQEKAYIKDLLPFLTEKPTIVDNENRATSNSYIKDELLERLREIETNAKGIIDTFPQNKIKCAAWVELLIDKGYFLKEHQKTNRKSCVAFAKERYNVDITIQMATAQNDSRITNKMQLEKYFK